MLRIVSVLIAVLALTGAAAGQTTFATITGIVTDPNGAVVPGATVTATQTEKNYRYTAQSNEAGYYTVGQMLEGVYVVRVESPGFKAFIARDVRLAGQDLRRLDVRMEIGAVETIIEVTGGATLIETEKARISDTKNADILKNLPLNTRSLWNFVGQNPGIVQAVSGTATRRFSGSRNNQSDASVDGITVSNARDGTQITPLVSYIESFEEVRVDMGNNTAEFGALGQVTVVSKSGTNELHGNGFDYYQTPMFLARNPFALTRGTNVTHTPGGSIGGPVFVPKIYNGKDRTFFFFSFETNRGSSIRQLLNPTVPIPSWRQGNFSGLLPGTVVRDPDNNNAPFAGNIIPAARLNPVSQKIQERFYPLPNIGDPSVLQARNYQEQKIRPFDPSTYVTVRGDHRFSDRSFVFGRFTKVRQYSRAYEANLPTIGQLWNQRDNSGINASWSYAIRPNFLHEFRYGYAYNDNPRHGNVMGKQLVEQLGLQGLVPDLPDINGILKVNWSGLGIAALTQNDWRHPGFKNFVHQFQDHVSWYRGRHSIKGGFIMSRVYYGDWTMSGDLFGNVTFSNRFTNHPYSDFLLGIPTTASRAFPNFQTDEVRWSYDFFVTDEFKVTPKLTLDIGMRYELHPPARNVNGFNSLFDIGTGKIVIPDGMESKVSPLLPTGYVAITNASSVGLNSRLLRTDKNNLAPRLGVAWRPLGPNTVFRAGFGIFYDVVPSTTSASTIPYVLNEPAFTNPTTSPTVVLPRVYPVTGARPSSVTLPNAVRTDLRIPLSMQYSATIEHQRWNTGFRVSYIGTNTRQGEWRYNVNQPLPGPGFFVDKPRMFPTYPAVNYLTNGAGHQYNAGTVEMKRRGGGGLTYQLSYTLARDIGDLERAESPENAYDRVRERSVWSDVPTHRVNGNVVWDLPVGRGKSFAGGVNRWANMLIGGWSISAIYTFHSGHFLTPVWNGPDPTGTVFSSGRTTPNATFRPDVIRDPNLPAGERTVNRWYDTAAFVLPAAGRFGSAAKGLIKGPHVNVWDGGVFKAVPITERFVLRLELTAVNVFNHPNYSDPSVSSSNPTQVVVNAPGSSGVITGVDGVSALDPSGARALRMGVRFEF